MVGLLGLCGSLRAVSSNRAALHAMATVAPPGVTLRLYDGLASLPHFNPDLEAPAPPSPVLDLWEKIEQCDGLVISSPEYAHGIAGSLKNAFDWLVGSKGFPGKPVMLINTAPRAVHAQASLVEILTTMSARLVPEAFVTLPLLGRGLDAPGIVCDPDLRADLERGLAAFLAAIGKTS